MYKLEVVYITPATEQPYPMVIMKSLCALLFLAALAVVYARPETSTFTTKYDNIDVKSIMENKRLRDKYFDCLMEKGKCTPDGAELKAAIPKAIQNECDGCSEVQRKWGSYIIRWFHDNDKAKFDAMMDKYDTDKTYRQKYKETAKKELGIEI